jgi:Domain of unknown function (DUF4365)
VTAPRKRRTREHVIADLSRVYVETVLLDGNCTAEQTRRDYGYDLLVTCFDADGFVEPGYVAVQLKATDDIDRGATAGAFRLRMDVRDYHLWTGNLDPVFLILFDARRRAAYWLDVQRYFADDARRRPRPAARSLTVSVPRGQVVGPEFVVYAREKKASRLARVREVIPDD